MCLLVLSLLVDDEVLKMVVELVANYPRVLQLEPIFVLNRFCTSPRVLTGFLDYSQLVNENPSLNYLTRRLGTQPEYHRAFQSASAHLALQ